MGFVRNCVALVLLLLVVASLSPAQAPTGTILGVVKDASGGVVADAAITITNTETSVTRSLTTDSDGAFRAPALPVGHYTVKAEKTGFQSVVQTGLTLEVGQELVVNPALQVGTSTQEVMVTGEVPVVNTTSSSLGGMVNEEKMADLPLNGRNWVDLAIMQPGVVQHTNISGGTPTGAPGETLSANGATTRSNNYTLDGASLASFNGTTSSSISGSTLGVDGIREFRVETNSFSAEFGLRMGSQATLVSKSGSNSFHGSAFDYLRNSSLDAANFFDTPAASGGGRLPPLKRNQFGGSVGGPIRKDKTFFFATFEGLQLRQGLTLIGTGIPANCRTATANPCATNASHAATNTASSSTPAYTTGTVSPLILPLLGNVPGTSTPYFALPSAGLSSNQYTFPFTRPVSEQFGQIRFDQSFSDKDTAFVRYTIDRDRENRPPTNLPSALSVDQLFSQGQFITGSETHIFTTNLLNTARFSASMPQIGYSEATPPYPGAAMSFIPGYPGIGMGGVTPGGGITATPSGASISQFHSSLQWSDDIFYTRGKHALKFGVLVTRQIDGVINANTNKGSITYSSLANFLEGATYQSYSALTPGSSVQRRDAYGTVGFYVQDDVRLTSRFTLNAGLRYEFLAPNYHEVNGLGAALRDLANDAATTPGAPIRNPSLRALSPRLGFAWDIRGDGKTSLRAGGALLYDIGDIGASIGQGAGGTPVGPAANGLGSTVTTVTFASGKAACPTPLLTIPFTFPSCWLAKNLTTFDYNSGQPHMLVWNVTVDRQLPWGVGLSTGYVGSRGLSLYNRIEGDPCIPEAVVGGAPNWANPTSTSCPLGRVNPNWTGITLATTNGDSWYNALQVVATKRLSKGLQFQGNFTWSKNLDTGNGQLPADNTTATWAPGFPKLDRAVAGFDVAKNFRFNAIYHLPGMSGGKFVSEIVNGWWVSGILSMQTGFAFNPTLNSNHSLSGVLGSQADRADIVPGRSAYSITHGVSTGCGSTTATTKNIPAGTPLGTPTLWFDPCAFTDTVQKGFLGNEPRNYIRGPALSELDFSAVKDTALKFLHEGANLQFRAEFFNIANHPNFAVPGFVVLTGNGPTDSPLTAAGIIQKTVNTSRQIQLALRLQF